VLAAVIAASGSSSESDDRAAADTGNAPAYEGELTALRRCQRLWNSAGNNNNRAMAKGMAEHSAAYVDVDYAADYPDKCLVTVAFSDFNRAMQLMKSGTDSAYGPYRWMGTNDADALPAASKGWSAKLNAADGFITVTGD
jgi:hypothetical protein